MRNKNWTVAEACEQFGLPPPQSVTRAAPAPAPGRGTLALAVATGLEFAKQRRQFESEIDALRTEVRELRNQLAHERRLADIERRLDGGTRSLRAV